MSYRDHSEEAIIENVRKFQKSNHKSSSSSFIRFTFDNFVKTLEKGDTHAKRTQKEIEKIHKPVVPKKSSTEYIPVYKKTSFFNLCFRKMISERS